MQQSRAALVLASLIVLTPVLSAQHGTVNTAGTGTAGVQIESDSAFPDVNIKSGNSTTSGFRVFNSSNATLLNVTASGNVAIGTSTTPAERLYIFEDADANTIAMIENPNAGTAALAGFKAQAGSNTVNLAAHGAGRTLSRFGIPTLGGWSEILNWQGNGLVMGTSHAAPLILGTSNLDRFHIAPDGKIGIGTANPTGQVHVYGAPTADAVVGLGTDISAGPAMNIGYSGASYGRGSGFINVRPDASAVAPNPSLRFLTANVQRMIITNTGALGIGTVAPQALLHLTKSAPGALGPEVKLENSGNFVGDMSAMTFASNGVNRAQILSRVEANPWRGTLEFYTGYNTLTEAMHITGTGRVGIGTATPGTAFDVVGSVYGVGLRAYDPSAVNTGFGAGIELNGRYDVAGNYTNFATIRGKKHNVPAGDRTGRMTIQTMNSAGSLVEVAQFSPGSMIVTGNAQFNGIVTGTEIRATYQDLAEWVPSRNDLAPGTVVVLDAAVGNAVTASSSAYDTSVAGVVSARPGIILGEEGADKEQIATTGRVRVRVDATAAPIRIGDLLVTSNKSGYAMKSIPVELSGISMHRPGTIVGKALESLAGGEGEILVLLSLQ